MLKHYDVDILYHPGKANVVADALSCKSMGSRIDVQSGKKEMVRDIHQLASLGVRLADSGDTGISVRGVVDSSILGEIKRRQYEDPVLIQYRDAVREKEKTQFEISSDGVLLYMSKLCVPDVAGLRRQYEDPVLIQYRDAVREKEKTQFEISSDGVLLYMSKLCVPDVAGLRRQVMGEAHYARYSVHPGSTKMYHDLRCLYWWDGMKRDIAEFVAIFCPQSYGGPELTDFYY